MKFNTAQKQAVCFDGSGSLLVLAGPGSGKTTTILNRVRFLIENKKVPPREILVMTFTRDAARSMEQRFRSLGATAPIDLSVNFGTFHSVFYQILRQSHPLQNSKLISEAEKRQLLLPILKLFVQENKAYEATAICSEVLSAIAYYKNTGDLKTAGKKLPDSWRENLCRVIASYDEERKKNQCLDYDDILTDCRDLLSRKEEILRYWQEKFRFILLDEFQDINPAQYEIIRLLAGDKMQVFAVGDDDQSIYGFRGSSPDCMKRFVEDFHAKKILLAVNYRSNKLIVDKSLAVIKNNKNRFPKALEAWDKEERDDAVRILGFADRREQYSYLENVCQEGECAVLFRTNRMMLRFLSGLKRKNIPYRVREKSGGRYQNEIVKDIMSYLLLAEGRGGQEDLYRVINKPTRYVSREVLAYLKTHNGPTEGGCLKDTILYCKGRDHTAYEALERLQIQLNHMKVMPLYLKVQYVRKMLGYDRWLEKKQAGNMVCRQDDQELLDDLTQEAGDFHTLDEWLEFQKEFEQEGKSAHTRMNSCGVQVMTVHAAKGLEFDHVYIPDCNERIYPYGQLQDTETIEEERRIFYVGMTRAKKELELLYVAGTKEYPKAPSMFLKGLL